MSACNTEVLHMQDFDDLVFSAF